MGSGAGGRERGHVAGLDPRHRLRAATIGAAAAGIGVGLGGGSVAAGVVTTAVALVVLYAAAPWFARREVHVRPPPSRVVTREAEGRHTPLRARIGLVLLLCIRGLALWVLWPAAFVAWVVHAPVRSARNRPLRLGQVAGWFDANLVALLESTLLRPFFAHRTRFRRWSRAAEIDRGPSLLDSW